MYVYLKRKYTIHYMSIYAWKFGISFLVYTWLLWSPLKGVKQVIKFTGYQSLLISRSASQGSFSDLV